MGLLSFSMLALRVLSRVFSPRQSATAESRPHASGRFSPTQLRPPRPLRGGAPAAGPDGKRPSWSAARVAREPGGGGKMGVSAHALPELGLAPGRGGDWSAVGARRVLRNSCARGGGGVRVRTRASGPSQQELPPRADRGATFVRIPAPGGSQAAVV